MIQCTHNAAREIAIWWSNNMARALIMKLITAKSIHQIKQQFSVAPRGHIIDNSDLLKSAHGLYCIKQYWGCIRTTVLTLTSSPSFSLPLQTGISSPEKKPLSAALTQRASKRVPKAVSYSWMFLFNISFVWFEIDLSPSHLDTGKQTSNWSTSIMWFWIFLHFVVPFGKRRRAPCGSTVPACPLTEMGKVMEDVWRMNGQDCIFRNSSQKLWGEKRNNMVILLSMPFCQQVANSRERPTD